MSTKDVHQFYSEKGPDPSANRFVLKCLLQTEIFVLLIWGLNVLDIFVVDQTIMNWAAGLSAILFFLPSVLCYFAGVEKPWVKYAVLFLTVCGTTVAGTTLSYHMVLFSAFPLFFAIQYADKKVVYYTYGLTVISVFVIVFGGYYFGLCDANMLVLTRGPRTDYLDAAGGVHFPKVNDNPWVFLSLYFVIPRCILLFMMTYVVEKISHRIGKGHKEIREAIQNSEIDEMTNVYNKNKYKTMMEMYYPSIEKVGVIFFDINNLKETNDRFGHAKGDALIMEVASDILQLATRNSTVYRFGGDEFVLIFENVTEELLLHTVNRWEILQKSKTPDNSQLPSVALGYALGKGEDIQEVVAQADQKMYLDKMQHHQENKQEGFM